MLENINSCIWAVATVIMMAGGIYFSFILHYPQFKLIKIFKSLKEKNKVNGISPLKTLFLTLAGRIGVGSIAGVALAIYLGGPGSIFWMWVIALISGSLAYAETMLSIKYKVKTKNGEYGGGPSYYIKNGLNKKLLAFIYSAIVIFAYLVGFIPIQANTITKAVDGIVTVNPVFIGLFIALISLIIIFGGIKKISEATSKIVPFMTILYILLAFIAVFTNLDVMPKIFIDIISSAFSLKPFLSGFIFTVLVGVQRGIFSNESGIGLGAIAACASNSDNGCKSGYIQVLGVYITTIVICTSTALMILTAGYNLNISNPNGIELTMFAFNYHFGSLGNILLITCILLFSFSTILTGYYYCESSFSFILKSFNKNYLKLFTFFSVFLGSIISPTTIWQCIDILVAFLALINIYVLLKLSTEIKQYHQKYDRI